MLTVSSGDLVKRHGSELLWSLNVPIDFARPWDLRGAQVLIDILHLHREHCGQFIRSFAFNQHRRREHFDLAVVDHFLQARRTAEYHQPL